MFLLLSPPPDLFHHQVPNQPQTYPTWGAPTCISSLQQMPASNMYLFLSANARQSSGLRGVEGPCSQRSGIIPAQMGMGQINPPGYGPQVLVLVSIYNRSGNPFWGYPISGNHGQILEWDSFSSRTPKSLPTPIRPPRFRVISSIQQVQVPCIRFPRPACTTCFMETGTFQFSLTLWDHVGVTPETGFSVGFPSEHQPQRQTP